MKMTPFLCLAFFVQFYITSTFAQPALRTLMTSRDLLNNNSASNISLHNNRSSSVTVYGLYVRQFSYVTPGDTCNHATLIYSATQNTTVGSYVMPTVIDAGKSAAVGGNYLYNMIYGAIYYVYNIFPSSPPGCALPGCTWGGDTTLYNWCIYLGALAPVSTSPGYTANVPPAVALASNAGFYDYNLINNYVSLGPISCNDQTLTCSLTHQQTQAFS